MCVYLRVCVYLFLLLNTCCVCRVGFLCLFMVRCVCFVVYMRLIVNDVFVAFFFCRCVFAMFKVFLDVNDVFVA